ncbi:hypothetical protein GCM10010523_29250 [Paenarthrobacter ilicis]
MKIEPFINCLGNDQQSLVQCEFRRGADDSHGNHGGTSVPFNVHYADPATGKARINSQYAKSQFRAFL